MFFSFARDSVMSNSDGCHRSSVFFDNAKLHFFSPFEIFFRILLEL